MNIKSVPTLVSMHNYGPVASVNGLQDKEQLSAFIERSLAKIEADADNESWDSQLKDGEDGDGCPPPSSCPK